MWDDVELRAYLAVLAKRWMLIVVVFLATTSSAAALIVLTTSSYRAQSQLFVSTQVGAGNINAELYQGGNFSGERVKSYTVLVTSPTVLDPVIAELGLQTTSSELADYVHAGVPVDTVLIEISADAQSPERAAALADSVGMSLARVIEELETSATSVASPVKATLVTPALMPDAPHWPSIPLVLGVGLLLGLLGGVGAALLREKLDASVKTADELGRADLAVLAEVSRDRRRGAAAAIVRDDPLGARSEAYRQLRTNLQFVSVGAPPKIMVVTSAMPGEGKSSVAGNLALSLSRAGGRVCLIDGDLRRPSIAQYFGLVGDAGLSTVILGRASVDDVLQPVDSGLYAITSGAIPPNPTELLGTPAYTRMLSELRERFDTVIVDAPPVLPAADAAVLAAAADGVIFVVQASRTGREQVERALAGLSQVHARVLGAVLNMVRVPVRGRRQYSYGSGYTFRSEGGTIRHDEFLAAGGAHRAPVLRDGRRPTEAEQAPADMEFARETPEPARTTRNGC